MKKFLSSAFLISVFALYLSSKRVARTDVVLIPQVSRWSGISSSEEPSISSAASGDASSISSASSSEQSSFSGISSSSSSKEVTVRPIARRVPTAPRSAQASSAPSSIGVSSSPRPVASSSTSSSLQGRYRDGRYTGAIADAFYGKVQVQVTVSEGRIADVTFLQHPSEHSESRAINGRAIPRLAKEAIQSQSAPVDAVSGATFTSQAFNKSFASALSQAKKS